MNLKRIFEEVLDEYRRNKLEHLYEMGSTLRKSDTGLPVNIWIDDIVWSTTRHKLKRMKFQPDTGEKVDTRKFIPISIEDDPKILVKNHNLKLDQKIVNQIIMFIKLNQNILIQYAEQKIGIKEFLAQIKLA
jgi:hypothetical protein